MHVIGVALDGNQAGIHHFLHLSRAEVRCHGVVGILVGVLADGNADGENGRLHVVFLEDRECILVVAQVAIVKREDNRFLGQRRTVVHIIAQLLERNRVIAGLTQRGNLLTERLRRNGSRAVHVLGQLVPCQHRNLNGGVVVRARRRTLREIVMWRVSRHISAEIRRNRGDSRSKVGIILLGNAGCHHLADVVAEVRAVVEEARLTADGRGRKIPVIGHFGERFVEIRDILVVKVVIVIRVHRSGQHDQINAVFLANLADSGHRFHAGFGLVQVQRLVVGIIGEHRIGVQIIRGRANRLHITHALVIRAGLLVEYIERLRHERVLAFVHQLLPTVPRVRKQKPRVIRQRRHIRIGLVVQAVGQLVGLVIVGQTVVQIYIQHQIFNRVVVDQVVCDLFAVLHIRAVHDEVVELGVQHLVERLGRQRAGGRAAEEIRVVFVVVLLEIGDFRRTRIVGLVIRKPLHKPVAERAERVGCVVESGQQNGQNQRDNGQRKHPFFCVHALPP